VTTSAYTAKAALFTRLLAYAQPAQPLAGLQVAYAFPGINVDLECLYGGGVRFEQRDAIAESPGLMVTEEATISIYIRVCNRPASDVQTTDTRAAQIGAQVGALLRAEPILAGGTTLLGISGGAGDYSQTDDETISILSYQVRASTNLSYGSP
jgi:hypothetical protein